MDRRDPNYQPTDQPRPNPHRGGRPQNAPAAGGHTQGNGPRAQGNGPQAQGRVNLNGDDIHVGRRQRRPARVSQAESQGPAAEEEWAARALTEAGSSGLSPVLQGLQGDHVWYDRSAYEEAESSYHRRRAGGGPGNGNHPPSSSPRNNQPSRAPNTSRTLTFHAKRTSSQQQQPYQEQTPSPGTPRRQPGRNRNRSSSEEANGGGGGGRGRGGYGGGRRRGFSESEGRPRRDNINMSGLECLAQETIWFDKSQYDEAETRFYEGANGPSHHQETETSAILQEIANARQNIQKSLDGVKTALEPSKARSRPKKRPHRTSSSHAGGDQELVSRMKSLELENQSLQKVVEDLRATMFKLESRVCLLEKSPSAIPCAKAIPVHQVRVVEQNGDDDEDSDVDLFGSDDEDDEEADRLKAERVAAYTAKKSNKPKLIAKSSILLDVKPWDDETDMAKLEECVRTVVADGLLWGVSKLVPVGYGIKKLQIQCVVEDDKVGTDMLEEEITKFEDYVQSVDIAAFNKI